MVKVKAAVGGDAAVQLVLAVLVHQAAGADLGHVLVLAHQAAGADLGHALVLALALAQSLRRILQ